MDRAPGVGGGLVEKPGLDLKYMYISAIQVKVYSTVINDKVIT